MTPNKSHLMRVIRVAAESPFKRARHGALLLMGHSVINSAFNCDITHAEKSVLCGAPTDRDLTVIVVRLHADGSLAMSKPCKACSRYMAMHGVRDVWWSDGDGNLKHSRLEWIPVRPMHITEWFKTQQRAA